MADYDRITDALTNGPRVREYLRRASNSAGLTADQVAQAVAAQLDAPCPDCGVRPGQRHENGCDVSRCPECGHQALACGLHRESGQSTWTGEWPGDAECREFGWWARWTLTTQYSRNGRPDSGPSVRCDADHPDAHPDLTRLTLAGIRGELRWDRDRERWVRP